MESSRAAASTAWQEAVITICVVALSLFAVWTVFGPEIDVELTHLLQPVQTPSSEAQRR